MPEFRLPLSGDVTQAINPWSWRWQPVASSFGLVNINLGHTPDPTLERNILDEVGTYGRQLGRIGEALQVLLAHLDRSRLNDDEKKVLWAFESQMESIGRLKQARRPGTP